MHDVAGSVAEDGVILILAFHGVAAVAALLHAVVLVTAEIPAARTLAKIAADRSHVANLERSYLVGRGRQRGKALLHRGVFGQRAELGQRPDAQTHAGF